MTRQISTYILSCIMVLAALFMVACEPDKVCHQELLAAAQIVLAADSVTMDGDTVSYSQWDSVRVVGVGHSQGLDKRNTKSLSLELRPDTTVTQFLIAYHDQIDTLIVEHTPRLQYVSAACGCAIYHTILQAWSTDPRVDSVSIINANVEPYTQDNLCIYLHE